MYMSRVSTRLLATPALPQLCRAPRLLISRSRRLYIGHAVRREYSSLGRTGARSLRVAARLLIVWIAPSLLRLCRASGHAISPLGRTGSRRAPGHRVSWHDYSSSGLHQLYFAYVVHPDVLSRCLVALALAVHPGTVSRGATTRRPDCTSSIAPMPYIRTHRLDTRLLVSQSH
jgi:hypothetical protein